MSRIHHCVLNWLGMAFIAASVVGCGKQDDATAKTASTDSKTAADSSSAKKPTIGVSLLTMANPFFKTMGDAMQAEAAKNGYEVRITSADNDPSKQQNQVKDFIVGHASAIILTPADSHAIGTAIREANAAGVPVFTADVASMDDGAKVVSHVATDNYGGGVQAAQTLAQAFGGTANVAIIDHPEVESVIQRTRGFETELAKTPGMKIVAKLPGGGDRQKSYTVMQDILKSHPEVNAVFAINDPSALGAVSALEEAKRLDQVKVVGFDGQPEAKKAVKEGKIFADATQDPVLIGKLAVEAFVKYAAGDKVEKQTLIPTKIYKKSDAGTDESIK